MDPGDPGTAAPPAGKYGVMDGSDADVIARSLTEPAAFGTVFDRHAEPLLRFFVRRVGPSAADGLLGEAFRIAFERRATFIPDRDTARPWLYGIATNVLAKHHRAEARRLRAMAALAARPPEADPPDDPGDRAPAAVDARRLCARVVEALADLHPGERAVVLLVAWEDLSYDDVATALGIPVGTVRSRLHRARHHLRTALASERITP
jgi:RNA polymerase sigma factor (sigma-70 family)